ncbi:hypothetical protein MPLA_680068 [Mesorhizobium sp. ORS 3359]|nr:hypothetical protein MPLA_680068 [Mesorhizobium sp. ORS 3359]
MGLAERASFDFTSTTLKSFALFRRVFRSLLHSYHLGGTLSSPFQFQNNLN